MPSNSPNKPTFKWDLTFSLGNLISLIGLFMAIIGGILAANRYFATIDGRVSTLETALIAIRAGQAATQAAAERSDAEIRVAIRRVDDKLTALLIQGYSRGANLRPEPAFPSEPR